MGITISTAQQSIGRINEKMRGRPLDTRDAVECADKHVEENEELFEALCERDVPAITHELADNFVTLCMNAEAYGVNLEEAVAERLAVLRDAKWKKVGNVYKRVK